MRKNSVYMYIASLLIVLMSVLTTLDYLFQYVFNIFIWDYVGSYTYGLTIFGASIGGFFLDFACEPIWVCIGAILSTGIITIYLLLAFLLYKYDFSKTAAKILIFFFCIETAWSFVLFAINVPSAIIAVLFKSFIVFFLFKSVKYQNDNYIY